MRAGLHVAEHRGAAGRERDMRVVGTDLLGAETSRLYLVLANGVIRITSPQWLGEAGNVTEGLGCQQDPHLLTSQGKRGKDGHCFQDRD